MIDVGPITPWELIKTLCTGTAVTEFNDILFKASGKTFEYIQTDFNEKICIATDEKSDEVKAWIENNEKQKLEGQGYPVAAYYYSFPPSYICPQPLRALVDKLVHWNITGIQSLDDLAWVNLHK